MEFTIGVREMIAWGIALMSLTLVFYTIIRNPSRQCYLAIQGILVACHKKAAFYAAQAQALRDSKSNTASLHDAQKIYEFVSNDYAVFAQYIFGVMASIQPSDLPVDVTAFLETSDRPSESSTSNSSKHYEQHGMSAASPNTLPNGISSTKPLMR